MRFWIYFKGNNNGRLVAGYRYAIGDTMTSLPISSSYSSCPTNSPTCAWQRIDVRLSDILNQPTEVKNEINTYL